MNNFEFKGTPGPWLVEKFHVKWTGPECRVVAPPAEREPIEILVGDWDMHSEQNNYPYTQKEADAHLIAAAPEMFELLVEMKALADSKNLYRQHPLYKKAVTILKKATGQEV